MSWVLEKGRNHCTHSTTSWALSSFFPVPSTLGIAAAEIWVEFEASIPYPKRNRNKRLPHNVLSIKEIRELPSLRHGHPLFSLLQPFHISWTQPAPTVGFVSTKQNWLFLPRRCREKTSKHFRGDTNNRWEGNLQLHVLEQQCMLLDLRATWLLPLLSPKDIFVVTFPFHHRLKIITGGRGTKTHMIVNAKTCAQSYSKHCCTDLLSFTWVIWVLSQTLQNK